MSSHLIVVGVALWLINRFIPTASRIETILNVVVVMFIGIRVLQAMGIYGGRYHLTAFR